MTTFDLIVFLNDCVYGYFFMVSRNIHYHSVSYGVMDKTKLLSLLLFSISKFILEYHATFSQMSWFGHTKFYEFITGGC